MVRYRRYKRKYSGTRAIKMKFQSFMDINTSDQSMQIITVSAGGPEVLRRLAPQFSAYKYYRLGSVSVKLVPASTLPVDPTGLSYEAGEPGVDPRDQLTPGLMRITNGEDIFENIAGMDDVTQHDLYNNMLLDPRWFKWMLQAGVKRYATPRYWMLGMFHQDRFPGMDVNLPKVDMATGKVIGTNHLEEKSNGTSGALIQTMVAGSSGNGLFQTGHSGRLGWLPTDGLVRVGDVDTPLIASPPEVEIFKILLPKAYKTKYYYRMFITETVYFKSPIVNFGIPGTGGLVYRPLDVFHRPAVPTPGLPGTGVDESGFPPDAYTGGNYGDN